MGKIAVRKAARKRSGRKRRRAAMRRHGIKAKRAGKRATHSLKRRSRKLSAIEAVVAAFAHDVRTPLTGILALGDLLATSGLGERERGWVGAIKDAAEHVADLTTLIVEGARAGAGRLPSRRQVFDLPALAASLAASLAARAQAKNLACQTDITPGLPQHVTGDPAQLRTALENLCANAVKFTERGAVGLKVAAAPLGDNKLRVTFTVTDSGIGMSAAEIRRLFRPFSQANPDIARRFGGAGLGLFQVRRLAKAMNGDLTLASTPGRGTTFRLTVTVDRAAPDADQAPVANADVAGRGAPRPLRVLCVEDNPFGRVVMNAILTELGHRVDFAGSGEAAVAAVANGGYDVVLMDVALAGLDGFEATRRIRALPGEGSAVVVVGISGRSEKADAEAAVAAGMQAYLTKPVSPGAVADALAKVQRARADGNAAPI